MSNKQHDEKNLKIINGSIANYKDYPFFGILYKDNETVCGSSYIGGPYNSVITAAHCLVDPETGVVVDKSKVKVGFLQSRDSIPNLIYNVSKIIIHPKYDPTLPFLKNDYDIAILHLTERPDKSVTTLRIPSNCDALRYIRPKTPALVIGYGLTCTHCNVPLVKGQKLKNNNKVVKTEPVYPQIMRKGNVCMISNKPSKYNLIPPKLYLTDRMILAAKYNNYPNPYDNVSICQGDSGGPLLHVSNGKYQLIGLVSFTVNGCGVTGYPGCFTYVNYFRYWIKENTKLCYIK